jgi:hypothetical protein
MTVESLVSRCTSAILLLSLASSSLLARGDQKKREALSNEEKAEIVESVLQLELEAQSSVGEFKYIRDLSSDNLEFLEPSRISRQGFILLNASQILNLKKNRVVEYVVFKRIDLEDGVAVVVFSRISEGRPCFAPAFSREQSFTYEYRKTSGEWTGRLIKRTPPSIPFGKTLSPKSDYPSTPSTL